VYCIGVLGFTFDDEKVGDKQVVHKVELKDQNNLVFCDKLTLIYLEMPNFNKRLEELKTRLDKWLYFIKNLEDLQSIPRLLSDKVFTSAFERAKLANLKPREQKSYQQSLKILRDNYATLKTAVEEAEARGGLNANLKTARNLKALGMNLEQIAAATGLSAEELEQNGIS
jgi:predicted transposase/invertase (TIGR01784 family)